MRISPPSLLLPPQSTSYERTQRARLLHVMLLALLAGAAYFALQNTRWGDIPSAISLFLVAGISVVGLWLNHRRHFRLAASLSAAMAVGVWEKHLTQLQESYDLTLRGWNGLSAGLKGEEVPLAARIFAVVDQWDALGSDRPYRKAWTRGQIISHFKKNAGRIYDPRIVDEFLSLVCGDKTF